MPTEATPSLIIGIEVATAEARTPRLTTTDITPSAREQRCKHEIIG